MRRLGRGRSGSSRGSASSVVWGGCSDGGADHDVLVVQASVFAVGAEEVVGEDGALVPDASSLPLAFVAESVAAVDDITAQWVADRAVWQTCYQPQKGVCIAWQF